MTRPGGTTGVITATAFDDRFPTQPIAVDRWVDPRRTSRGYRQPPPSRPRHHAPAPGGPRREPARRRSARVAVLIGITVVIAALIGALGYRTIASSSPWAAPAAPTRSAPAPAPPKADDSRRPHPAPGAADQSGDRRGALGQAGGAVPDGTSVFDDDLPAVAELDADLLAALRAAATDAADDRVEFVVNSGWRSPQYQEHLLDEAIAKYGSKEEAARWVATADTSPHVSGNAVDIGPTRAAAWLSEHGAEYGLCQIYRNEPWHYELRPDAVDHGCPRMYADPTQDPRMR